MFMITENTFTLSVAIFLFMTFFQFCDFVLVCTFWLVSLFFSSCSLLFKVSCSWVWNDLSNRSVYNCIPLYSNWTKGGLLILCDCFNHARVVTYNDGMLPQDIVKGHHLVVGVVWTWYSIVCWTCLTASGCLFRCTTVWGFKYRRRRIPSIECQRGHEG